MQRPMWFLALAAALISPGSAIPAERLLPLPPMGFNNWARYQTNISESIFVDAAEAMIRTGLLAARYNRINLDDAWSTNARAASRSLVWDPVKFPRGFPWLTQHLKSQGFLPGIYSDAGGLSCAGYPGSLDYEDVDLKDFTAWGFKFLKMDGCNLPDGSEATYHSIYGRWHRLLSESNSNIIFSDSAPAYFSNVPDLTNWYASIGWAREYGHLARHSGDIQTYPKGRSWDTVMFIYRQHLRLARFQKPGFFNDPDFLNVDHPSYSMDEKKSHFALWCVFSAPLLLSADLTALSNAEIQYLTNHRLINVNQDSLVQQATLVSSGTTWDVLTKSVDNGDRVVAVLNKGDSPASVFVSWERLGFSLVTLQRVEFVTVQDLWTGKRRQARVSLKGISVTAVPSHGTAVYRISQRASGITPTGLIFNSNNLKCLTDHWSGLVTWSVCDGSDAQVWKVYPEGLVNSLLQPAGCLMQIDQVFVSSRSPGRPCDKWKYYVSGNLINTRSGLCLTEGRDGVASTVPCGYLRNDQVLSLPIGVVVLETGQRDRWTLGRA
ncbi:Alpha-galactosidase [Ophiocordyceps camponoti-floridani]|uniref:Alpha-galactosidase n=1 Tax=Ophiocordyceps camponoti-floridani TaxID=2030778 RepID=A0A8H4VHH7_9HYPO|nr:Alpha-galactosidase [Ophiocordyceps camponoti-floridani]